MLLDPLVCFRILQILRNRLFLPSAKYKLCFAVKMKMHVCCDLLLVLLLFDREACLFVCFPKQTKRLKLFSTHKGWRENSVCVRGEDRQAMRGGRG